MAEQPALVANYCFLDLPVTGRDGDGQLIVWYEGREHVARELVVDGQRLEDVTYAPAIVPAAPGIFADFGDASKDDREVVWSPPVVAWRIHHIGSCAEAIIARNNPDGAGPISDVSPVLRFLGFRHTGGGAS